MYTRRRKTRTGCCLLQFLIAIILLAVLGWLLYSYTTQKPKILSPLADDYMPEVSLIEFVRHEKNPEVLKKLVKDQIGSSWKNYSIYVVDYTSKFRMDINISTIYSAASISKVPILAALYMEAQKGAVDFDRVVTTQPSDIQDYGTGSIRYDPVGSTYSVSTLARLMIQKSDNTAAYILANYIVGLNVIQKYVDSWGMTQTDMVNNKTSNNDMEIIFEKIINKKLTNPAYADEMLGLLKDSDFEDRIPGQLPKDAVVYHKIGTGIGAVHDVGVVVYGKTKYYVGIFTSDIIDEEQTAKKVSDVSKTIFEFMKS